MAMPFHIRVLKRSDLKPLHLAANRHDAAALEIFAKLWANYQPPIGRVSILAANWPCSMSAALNWLSVNRTQLVAYRYQSYSIGRVSIPIMLNWPISS